MSKYITVILRGLALSLMACSAQAWSPKTIDVSKLNLRYQQFKANRDPMTPQYAQEDYAYRAALDFDIQVLEYAFWENTIHMETIKSGQVKTVGWHWIAGVRLGRYLDLIHEHHSRHVLDEPQSAQFPVDSTASSKHYPVEDSYGVRIHLLGGRN